MKKSLTLLTLLAGISLQVQADSMFEEKEDAIEYRKAAFQLIRYQIGDMGDMLKGKVPFDAERFKQRAHNAAQLSSMPWEAFVTGSDKGNTSALPSIWSDRATFDKKAADFAEYAQALAIASESGDKKVIAPAFRNWAKGCKDCHKSFKD
ncbi:c-type cytochrome [Pseudoalteromonas luteoviolacea]|uniref:Cytochrome C n=1 Tax=Pseudoalteromonas luteoviolacea S4054 TaxID=1129367 RepID=A0A0F6AGJ1_9GAMM|nr:cytochrome c [Pseudoalteromonas luteoviolacea]AOT10010.1 cytochrome C [Pseudoalteromonas luteoviolacea]AOT14921.1 cytochrome C [Pseudoalteromonas luteoviolacea]AOT19837.1 cytochrome C [Pseudoalteromonas luteoviolacea]KKE84911.1 cytochrome C [Pseudoalteromonas luteoviolacea S4054]KZN72528.1 cytochrome C [Pseudoalteromonas luteoviolacea S4047-1]